MYLFRSPSPSKYRNPKSRLQQQLPRGLPPFDILGRTFNVLQWIHVMNLDIQPILLDKVPQLFRILQCLFPCVDVIEQRGSQQFDILGREAPIQCPISSKSMTEPRLEKGHTYARANPVTGPEALPKETMDPFRRTVAKQLSNVALPTESNTTCTPSPPVIFKISLVNFSRSSS